ncbi:odorant receptor 2a-like [Prorops nasuta]|uniref:odorant receptor 2a-like n=1 Tax=Prorops nasuta TaxID=863751 RepID=UPI0034CFEECB
MLLTGEKDILVNLYIFNNGGSSRLLDSLSELLMDIRYQFLNDNNCKSVPRLLAVLQKTLLTLCGAWPYETNTWRCFILRVIFVVGTIFFFSLPQLFCQQWLNFRENMKSLDTMMACLPFFVSSFIATWKGYLLYYNSNGLKILLEDLKRDWEYCSHVEAESNIIKKYAKLGKLITIIYAGSIQMVLTLYYISCCVSPVLDIILPLNESRSRYFILQGDLYVHTEDYFFFILTMEWYGIVVAAYYTCAFDSLYITFMLHICGVFAVLSQKLETLKVNNIKRKKYNLSQGSLAPDEIIYRQLSECIKLHLRCIKYVDQLNSTLSAAFFPDLFLGVLLAGASAYMFVTSMNDLDQQIRNGMLYTCQTLRIFVTSVPGQLLIDHSSYVYTATCNNQWYDFPKKSKQLLLIFMMGSMKPTEFIVAKIFTINRDLFTKISRACLSYCTVMLSVQNR